jgi:hypothetical protein
MKFLFFETRFDFGAAGISEILCQPAFPPYPGEFKGKLKRG